MAISNKLLVNFNHAKINEAFDFYQIVTIDKYINSGSYVIDKPIEQLRAESVTFDGGRSLFVMFKKGMITRYELADAIEDDKLSLKQVTSNELKDYILFRLFLFSLNNFKFDNNKFNNITGKFYITNPSWMSKNRDTFKALNVTVDQSLSIVAEASTFTRLSLFPSKKSLSDYPKYVFSNKNNALKRVLHPEVEDEVYIRKSLFGVKAEIPFFIFSQKKIKDNKVFFIYRVLDFLREKFDGLLSFEFENINIVKSIGRSRDAKINERIEEIVAFKNINFVNWSNSPEYDEEFDDIVNYFAESKIAPVTKGKIIEKGVYNVVYLHHKDYYTQHSFNDPYKNFPSNEVIQHITIEDSADKIIDDKKVIYDTILKELLIKDDIINNNKISLDDWSAFGFINNYIFGKEKDGIHYFLNVKPDGSFECTRKINDLTSSDNKTLDKCSDYLTDNKGKEKTVIADSNGNVIVISRTPMFTMPNEHIFNIAEISRSKESREQYLSGLVDINLYEINGKSFYSVGIQGYGMNTSIPKATHLYEVDVVEGHNFIEELMETMAVSFVKFKSFTVLPYPVKYLNEYILMCESTNQK